MSDIFAPAVSYQVGRYPISLSVIDVNGDGNPDALTANIDNNSVSVLLGNGNGGFTSRQDYEVGYGPQILSLADVNLDGKLDMVVASFGNSISILLCNGQGSSSYKSIDLGTYAIVATDVNT